MVTRFKVVIPVGIHVRLSCLTPFGLMQIRPDGFVPVSSAGGYDALTYNLTRQNYSANRKPEKSL